MTIRVFNEGWRHQYHRMKRSRDRFNAPHQIADEYDDDFYHAIQDTWHLKDWIANDAALGPLGSRIAQEASTIPLLDIIADLANGTKHLVLTNYVPIVHRSCSRDEYEIGIMTTLWGSQSSLKNHRMATNISRGGAKTMNASCLICILQ